MRIARDTYFWSDENEIIATVSEDFYRGKIEVILIDEQREHLDACELEEFLVSTISPDDAMDVLAIRGAVLSLTRGVYTEFEIEDYLITMRVRYE